MVMHARYFFVFILAFLKGYTANDDLLSLSVNVEVYDFNNCPSEEPFPISFENLTMRMEFETKKLFVSGILVMKVPWTVDTEAQVKLSKCLSRDDANSCNKYFEANMNELCGHLAEKNKQWTPFIEAVKFDPHCPVKEGRYDVIDAPIATAMLEKMHVALGIWHVGFTAKEQDALLMCTNAAIEIKRARRGKKRPALF